MKVELVVTPRGMPISVLTAPANIAEVDLAVPVVDQIPFAIPDQTPLIGDKGYDSDPLRDAMKKRGFVLISPHRKNRRRKPTNDARRIRRYRHRWRIERTNAWIEWFRRVLVRWEYYSFMYLGFVQLANLLLAARRF